MATGLPIDGTFVPGSVGATVQQVELSISARNLMDMDRFSLSDPMCVLFHKPGGSKDYREFGRTETIDNTLNPNFVKKFVLDYYFEERQQLLFRLFDIDSGDTELAKHDFLGEVECSLGEIVSNGKFEKDLKGKGVKRGKIIITAEELCLSKEDIILRFRAQKLDKKDFFGKSDPFLEISRANEDTSFTVVHRTEVKKTTLNPAWAEFRLPVSQLCMGDYDRLLKFAVLDWNRSGRHTYIGETRLTLREMTRGPNNFDCVNEAKKAKKGKKYKNSGVIYMEKIVIEPVYTFLDYVSGGGTELNCTIAIDFTASNGNPQQSDSLHYLNPSGDNQYSLALRAVGEIIRDYDSDKQFPVLGFGAKIPPSFQVSHEFFVNLNPTNPFCYDIAGVLEAYNRCVRSVQLYGPTNFAPCINHVARFARENQSGSEYFILLIITDGVITDMPQTKEAIVQASTLPLSIIIVGVGTADFDAMEELDGDEVRVSSRNVQAARDIVQFVPFRDFMRNGVMGSNIKARLAKEVLAEIPDQFVSFMKSKNIKPRQRHH